MWWSDGSCYEGDWDRDLPNGYGLESYADGSFYAGSFKADERNGWGIYSSEERSTFAGDWVEGVLQGLAIIGVEGARARHASLNDSLSSRADVGGHVVFPLTVENGQLLSNPDTGVEEVDEILLHVVEKSLSITVGLTDKAVADARQKVMKHRQRHKGAPIPPSPTTKIVFVSTTPSYGYGGSVRAAAAVSGSAVAAPNAAASSVAAAAASNKTHRNVEPVDLIASSTASAGSASTPKSAYEAPNTHGGMEPEDMNPLKDLYTRLAAQAKQGISPLSGARREFGNSITRPRLGFREGVLRDS